MGLTLQKLEQPRLSGRPFFWFMLLFFALCFSIQRVNALNIGAVSITNKSGTRFILDSNDPCGGPRAAYVAYSICNTSLGILTNLSATLSGLEPGFALQSGQPVTQTIGTLTPGACTTLFWYLSYPCVVNSTMTVKITVSDSNPGTVQSQVEMKTRSSISATAGGLLGTFTTGPGLILGSTTYYDQIYELGNVPNNGFALFQPAGNLNFDASCLQLIGTTIISTDVPLFIPLNTLNTLNFIFPSSLGGGTYHVTVRYTFKVKCNSISTEIKPYGASSNGNNVKHTSNYGTVVVNAPNSFPPPDPCLVGTPEDFAKQLIGTDIGLEGGGDDWGASWGDYNNDNYPDLFVTTHDPNQPNALYRNNGNGSFTKVSTAPFSTDLASSVSSSWGDYDNDGDLDLYVGNNIGFENYLYRNEGGENFTKVLGDPIVSSTGYSHGVSWGDYDNDGFLDMFVAVYWETAFNLLYHNNGDGTFSEVTNNAITNEASRSVSGVWGDYDNDGLLDLFVANTGGQNNSLYHNAGGGNFQRVTTGTIVNDGGSSVGASWADYNNDGYFDLFVTNAGNEPCYLYQNNGNGTFTKITTGNIVTDRGNAHGSAWADWDNDGDLDLFVARDGDNNSLYRNDGNDSFTSIQNEITTAGGFSFGAAWADYDHDGDLDLFVANREGTGNFFYKNLKGTCKNWTSIKLIGTNSNKSAIGAKILVTATINGQSVTQIRMISGQTGGGTGGQNSLVASIGLGNASVIASIQVIWPSGYRQTLSNQAVNQFLVITEDDAAEVSGQVYYEENIDCNSGSGLPQAAQSANYRSVQAGNWNSASTWAGGVVPSYSNIFNKTISIEHDVTITNGNIYINGNSQLFVTNAKLTLQNGNLTIADASVKLLGGELNMENGNFDIVGSSGKFEAQLSKIYVTGGHYSIGSKKWKNAVFQLSGSYNNAGIDTLQSVKMEIGGNFQNYIFGKMVVEDTKVHVTNGGFQNLSPAEVNGTGLVIWLDNGNIQNTFNLTGTNWSANISQYCTPAWANPVGVSPYLPAAKDCATIASQFVVDPSQAPVGSSTNRIGVPNARVEFQPGNTVVYADENGYYSAFLPTGSYTLQESPGSNFNPQCPNNSGQQSVTVAAAGLKYANVDFGNSIVSNLPDLTTEIFAAAHRIGQHNLMIVNYKNIGTAAARNVELKVTIPSEISVLLSSLPYSSDKSTTSVLTFGLADLAPQQQGTVFISYTVDPLTPIGTEISLQADIGNGNAELSQTNNSSVDKSQTVAAFDPNDISVSPARYVKRDEWLYYKIRFQNVGNIPAAQIRVEDELTASLDISTLELGSASHTYRLQVDKNHKLTWIFPNINLPDSLSNEAESHGYVSFRIKPATSLVIGDHLLNQASIFFDNLEPVVTNTVENVLTSEIVKETKAVARPLQLFPNPSSGKVMVQSFDLSLDPASFFVEMKVFNQFGRQVYEAPVVEGQRQELYLYHLGTGSYIVKAVDSKGRGYFGKMMLMKN
ncbi:MAG: hypothetical protein GC192_06785 [Bacteroidetes bacterium]|nr:hypothetical protein [Bacteroidota bacterium]